MTLSRRVTALILALLALAFVGAGCGGDDNEGGALIMFVSLKV
jgi:hypothetical protein